MKQKFAFGLELKVWGHFLDFKVQWHFYNFDHHKGKIYNFHIPDVLNS